MFAETAVACSLLISPFDEGKTVEEESDCDPPDSLKVTEELREQLNNAKHAPYENESAKKYAQYLVKERNKNEEMTKELEDKEEEIEELLEEIERMKKEEKERESKQNRAKNNKKEVNNDIRNNPPNNTKPVRDDKGTNVEEKERESKQNKAKNDKKEVNNNNVATNNSTNNDVHSTTTNRYAELLEVEATFYTAMCDTGCTGTTATGLNVKDTIYTDEGNRIIAVDPSVIPLGSKVKIIFEDGTTFTASAEDTGGDIKGQRIDVLVESKEDAERLGRQTAAVEVIS